MRKGRQALALIGRRDEGIGRGTMSGLDRIDQVSGHREAGRLFVPTQQIRHHRFVQEHSIRADIPLAIRSGDCRQLQCEVFQARTAPQILKQFLPLQLTVA